MSCVHQVQDILTGALMTIITSRYPCVCFSAYSKVSADPVQTLWTSVSSSINLLELCMSSRYKIQGVMLFSIVSQPVGHVLVEVFIFGWMVHKLWKIRPSVNKWYNNKMYTNMKIYLFRKRNYFHYDWKCLLYVGVITVTYE